MHLTLEHCKIIAEFMGDDMPKTDNWYVNDGRSGIKGWRITQVPMTDKRIPALTIADVLSKPFLTALGEKLRRPVPCPGCDEGGYDYKCVGKYLLDRYYSGSTEAVGEEICKWITNN